MIATTIDYQKLQGWHPTQNVYSVIQIFVVGSERRTYFETERNCPSRSSKVVDFGTNRKRVCHFLFVVNSNLGPILPRFRDIADFLLKTAPHPYSTQILVVFPLD